LPLRIPEVLVLRVKPEFRPLVRVPPVVLEKTEADLVPKLVLPVPVRPSPTLEMKSR